MTTSRSTPRVRFIAVMLLLAIIAVACSRRAVLAGVTGQLAQWIGLACITVSALGRVWTSAFIAGFKDENLVRTGPYAACRHPLYSLSLLGMMGAGLATRSVTLAAIMLCGSAWAHWRALRREESLLAARHGPLHDAYRTTVPALWPDLSRHLVPDTLEIRPRVYWKAFLDAGSIFGVYLLIVAADLLQTHGVTPTLFDLP